MTIAPRSNKNHNPGSKAVKHSGRTVHMIGNAHLDPAWLWTASEGYQEAIATFSSALDRIQETPSFIFTKGESAGYEWIEHAYPELFAQIKKQIKAGRIAIVNGWVVQADCNLPRGEAFVRQALYGQKYFRERFGIRVHVAYCVDSFGHNANLPQILKKCGYDLYVHMRPIEKEKHLPTSLYWWEAPDGSRVLACRVPAWEHGGYGIYLDTLKEHIETSLKVAPKDVRDVMCLYGVGNHGGGPTKAQIRYIREQRDFGPDVKLVFSSPERFLRAVSGQIRKLPVIKDELQYFAIGCYSSVFDMKQMNRRCEYELLAAERWSAVAAAMTDMPYPSGAIETAWKKLLFNQFHDVLCGTCVEETNRQARERFGAVADESRELLHRAWQRLANRVNTRGPGLPLIVWNPSAWRRQELTEASVCLGITAYTKMKAEDLTVADADGRPVLTQLISGTGMGGPRWVFRADVPPLGYRVYYLMRKASPGKKARAQAQVFKQLSPRRLENKFLRLELDPRTGWIRSLYDKRRHAELLRSAGNVPVVLRDRSCTWGIFKNRAEYKKPFWTTPELERFDDEIARVRFHSARLIESGPVRAAVELNGKYGKSRLVLTLSLPADESAVYFHLRLYWNETFKMLKLEFPFNLADPRAIYEIPYGSLARPANGHENPGLAWIMVQGRKVRSGNSRSSLAVCLANDSVYGYDVRNNTARMTIVRSVPYAYMGSKLDRSRHIPCFDQGEHHIRYALYPLDGASGRQQCFQAAESLNLPLRCVSEHTHAGDRPRQAGFLELQADHTHLEVLKRAEDGQGHVFRLVETEGKPEAVALHDRILNRRIRLVMRPHEVKTLRLPLRGKHGSRETNMVERV